MQNLDKAMTFVCLGCGLDRTSIVPGTQWCKKCKKADLPSRQLEIPNIDQFRIKE